MTRKDQQRHARSRLAIIMPAVLGGVILMAAGCGTKPESHANSSGNFKPGGTTSKGKAPDCYEGTGSGTGQFKRYSKFAADAPEAPASGSFEILLGHGGGPSAPSPMPGDGLLLGWGGGGSGGGGGHDKKPC